LTIKLSWVLNVNLRTVIEKQLPIRRLISLILLFLLLSLMACSSNTSFTPTSQASLRHNSQDNSEQRSVASDTEPNFMLHDREISPEELEELASFAILWPDQVPADCSLKQIAEMSESDTQSSGSGIFFLKYQCGPLRWFHIRETGNILLPHLADYSVVDRIVVKNVEIPIYKGGSGMSMIFLELEGVNVQINAQGLSSDELVMIVTNLRSKQQ
jgi:hypothetical protein